VIVDAASPGKANMQWIKCDPLRADAIKKVRGTTWRRDDSAIVEKAGAMVDDVAGALESGHSVAKPVDRVW
jgi:hypothetical protein